MQAAGNLVTVVVEFAAGMQHRHDDLDRRPFLRGVHIHGDAAPVVEDTDRAVRIHRYVDALAEAGERFIHAVVHDLEHTVVQPANAGVADIHGGALANSIHAAQDRDGLGVVSLGSLFGLRRRDGGGNLLIRRRRLGWLGHGRLSCVIFFGAFGHRNFRFGYPRNNSQKRPLCAIK